MRPRNLAVLSFTLAAVTVASVSVTVAVLLIAIGLALWCLDTLIDSE